MPTKRETHRADLRPLLLNALHSAGLLSPPDQSLARYRLSADLHAHLLDPDITALEDYLLDHSHLPGQRANLELVAAFGDEVGALCADPDLSLNHSYVALGWLIAHLLTRYPPAVFGDDPDSPLQMPQFCGLVAQGEWAVAFHHVEAGVATLLDYAGSPLWRIREGVAFGLQRMLRHDWTGTINRLRRRALDASPYEWRAIVAGVAEPPLLDDPARALDALDLHYAALAALRRLPAGSRRADPVRTLRQALTYSVSVVVAAAPEAGFAQMHAWAAWNDPDVAWVLRENLKKKRLAPWPHHIDALRAALTGQKNG